MNICYSCDNKYFDLMVFSIASILENNTGIINIFVLYQKIDNKNFDKLKIFKDYTVNFEFIKINNFNYDFEVPNKRLNNPENYFRFLVPNLIKVKKILFLDVDTFIRGNLNDLYYTNINDHYLAGVRQSKKSSTFNAGVMLLDLDKLRQNQIFTKIIEYLVIENKVTLKNWQATEVLINNNFYELNPIYNFDARIPRENIEINLNDIIIVHYMGRYKPNLCGVKGLFSNEYKELIRATRIYKGKRCKIDILKLLHIKSINVRLKKQKRSL